MASNTGPLRFNLERTLVAGNVLHRVTDESSVQSVQRVLTALLPHFDFYCKQGPRYPGPLPVSLDFSGIEKVKSMEYFACEKNDGERLCCCFVRINGYKVSLALTRRGDIIALSPASRLPRAIFNGTVVDAELATSKAGSQQQVVTFFDALCVAGANVEDKAFVDRIGALNHIMYSYFSEPSDPVAYRIKPFFRVKTQFKEFLEYYYDAQDAHPLDGIIFVPNEQPIKYGRDTSLFKWKSPMHHTIDFVLDRHGAMDLFVYDRGRLIKVAQATNANNVELAGKVVECQFVTPTLWKIVKERPDKMRGNDLTTYQSTLATISQDITMRVLFSALVAAKA